MYARLWWKEARVYWPIWVAIALIAAGTQWCLLWNRVPEARDGFLIVLGLGWSTLYALAVGAGVLAGERESKTQVFLDTLPVGRNMQWTSKVSFALVTTLALTLALTALGVQGTAQINRSQYPLERLLPGFGVVLLEGVAWSLFWSVVLRSSLQAALAGLLTVGSISLVLMQDTTPHTHAVLEPVLSLMVVPRLVLACAALVLSWLIFAHQPLPGQPGWARQQPFGPRSPLGRLIWETERESRRSWMLLAAPWIGFLLMGGLLFHPHAELWLVFAILTNGAAAGASVFGPANRAQTYRFLADHGVPPGSVWKAKLVVWSLALTVMVAGSTTVAGAVTRGWTSRTAPDPRLAIFLIFEAFVVGLLAGQVVRRSITAWVVALLAFLFLVLPQIALWNARLVPTASLALFPALVLAISRAWTGDWMNDRRGAARWLRLGGMIGAAAGLLVLLYIGYRGLSVPDIGDPFPLHLPATTPVWLRPDQDAAPDYMRLIAELRARDDRDNDRRDDSGMFRIVDSAIVRGWDPKRESVVKWWEKQRSLVEPIRRAAAKPEARFSHQARFPHGWHSSPDPDIASLSRLVLLLGLDNFERRSRGDLAGAWDDLRAAVQITNQLGRSGKYDDTFFAATWRCQILQWALVWAVDSRQTPGQLRAAIAEFHTLLQSARITESLEAEYNLRARMLRGESTESIDFVMPEPATNWSIPRALAAAWWERVRTLRILRLLYARQLEFAQHEPWQGKPGQSDADFNQYLESTPLVRLLAPDYALISLDRGNIVRHRAFDQVAALRIWQLEHDGYYPGALEELVPGILPSLPPDPYSGQPFRYRRSHGQRLLPLGLSGNAGEVPGESPGSLETRTGQWLLYSVGPNRNDDHALVDYEMDPRRADLIFPLPPESRPEHPFSPPPDFQPKHRKFRLAR